MNSSRISQKSVVKVDFSSSAKVCVCNLLFLKLNVLKALNARELTGEEQLQIKE
jgi:hypothetical protein